MNNRIIGLSLVGLTVSSLPLTGCSLLAARPDPSRFFTFAALAATERSHGTAPRDSAVDAHQLTYGLGPIKVPAYLDRNEIATRVSPSEVIFSAADYWAEPLQANVSRVLLQNLSALRDTDRITTYPWPVSLKVDYQVQIEVLHFERDAGGNGQLSARWGVGAGTGGGFLVLRESSLTRSATAHSTADSVAALSGTLSDLSQEIATALRQLPPPGPDTKPSKKRS